MCCYDGRRYLRLGRAGGTLELLDVDLGFSHWVLVARRRFLKQGLFAVVLGLCHAWAYLHGGQIGDVLVVREGVEVDAALVADLLQPQDCFLQRHAARQSYDI